jgi:hypothetical protein
MTPENVNAQEQALEALVAASLRAPGKQSDVTESELRRFVDQQVTLSVEDEAALTKAKPNLKQQVRDILQCGHRTAAPVEREIPQSLLTLGERKHLMLPQMHTLLNMRLQIIGHRCDSGDDDLESFDWERFYEKVKEYIK